MVRLASRARPIRVERVGRYVLRHQSDLNDELSDHDTIDHAHARADLQARQASALAWRQELFDLRTNDRWTRVKGQGWLLEDA